MLNVGPTQTLSQKVKSNTGGVGAVNPTPFAKQSAMNVGAMGASGKSIPGGARRLPIKSKRKPNTPVPRDNPALPTGPPTPYDSGGKGKIYMPDRPDLNRKMAPFDQSPQLGVSTAPSFNPAPSPFENTGVSGIGFPGGMMPGPMGGPPSGPMGLESNGLWDTYNRLKGLGPIPNRPMGQLFY